MESRNHNASDVTTLRQLPRALYKQSNASGYYPMVDSSKRRLDPLQFVKRLQISLRDTTSPEGRALLRIGFDRSKAISPAERRAVDHTLDRRFRELVVSAVDERQVIAQLSGDDYVLLLQDTSEAEAVRTARMLRAIVQRLRYQGRDTLVEIGVSIGVVIVRDTDTDATAALADAGHACAEAKRKAYNHVVVNRR